HINMKLLDRIKIFTQLRNISSLVKGFQTSFFDAEYDKVEDEMFDAMLLERDKIITRSFSLMFNHPDANSYPNELAKALSSLLKYLNTDELILISHLKLDLFGNLEHEDKKVIKAYAELSK